LDWQLLLDLADEHGMLGLLAARLEGVDDALVPSPIGQKLREWRRAQTIFTLSLTAELFRVLDRFAASGIEAMVIKGPPLAVRCYGDPGLRQYTDLDLIVRDRDIQRCTEAMIALGFAAKVPLKAIRAEKSPGEYVFTRPGNNLMVELHTERTFRYYPRQFPLEALFQRRIRVPCDGHEVPALGTEDELLLISIHGAKHFWTRLMWIADVAALVARQNVAGDRAMAAAREAGAERMLGVALRLAVDVLNVPLPAQVVSIVSFDATVRRIAGQIARRLPLGDAAPLSLFERARFRMKMRGRFVQGAGYLLRLSLSPTEEDWVEGAEEKRPQLLDALRRPFRLARKHGRADRM
jgi:Uncharacterised nucleotidyltransferase